MAIDKDKLNELFFQACDLDGEDRAAFLNETCGEDNELRAELERLIQHGESDERSDDTYIVSNVVEHAAREFVEFQDGTPKNIGPYTIIKKIGEGGMSVVYEAEQLEPVKRRVALKVIRPGMDTREVISRFEAERQALAVMDHVNIAQIFDGGETPKGRPYFVMELVGGELVTDYCDNRQLDVYARLKIFNHVCSAVQHAHQKGVVHRDLKPSNILVSEQDGHPLVKVIDFGIAKALDAALSDDPTETRYGQIIGTPSHMSPEQAAGVTQDIDTRTDVYSLGIVLFQLLVGELPYETKGISGEALRTSIPFQVTQRPSIKLRHAGELRDKIARVRSTTATALAKLIESDLDWIVVKAMEPERQRRYQTINAFSTDINNFLDSRPVTARPPSRSYLFSRFVRRNRKTVLAISVMALGLFGGMAMATIGFVKATNSEREARKDQRQAERSLEYLVDTYELLDPETSLGERILAKDLLMRSAERIEAELKDEPEIQLRLLQTVGRALENLALYDRAEPMLRQSLGLRISSFGENDARVADAHQELGELLMRIGKYAESRQELEKALQTNLTLYGEIHPRTAQTKAKLGISVFEDGDYDGAEALFAESQGIYQALKMQDSVEYAQLLNNLGGIGLKRNDVDSAKDYFEEALSIWQQQYGDIHPDIALAMTNLGVVFAKFGDFEESENFYQRALEMRRQIYQGQDHSEIAVSLNNLAMLYRRQDKLEEAEPLLSESLEIRRKVYGDMSPAVATGLNNLAGVLRARGEFEKAEQTYRESLLVRRVLQGEDHPNTGITQANLAETMIGRGLYKEGLREINQALVILQTSLGPVHWRVASALSVKASALAAIEDSQEAESMLISAFEEIRKARGDKDVYTHRAVDRLIDYYALRGRADELNRYTELKSTLTADE